MSEYYVYCLYLTIVVSVSGNILYLLYRLAYYYFQRVNILSNIIDFALNNNTTYIHYFLLEKMNILTLPQ